MKIFIKKVSYLMLALTLLLVACEEEDNFKITSADPEFVLNTPGISSILLNFSLPDNPAFTLTWNDDLTGASTYNVEMAIDDAFTTPIQLGTTDKNNFSMTVTEFNDVINNSGTTDFRDAAVYVRLNTGSEISNTVLLLVTTYPTNPPVITSPAEGDSFILALANGDDVALTVEWSDPILDSSTGATINYVVEAATAGTDFATPVIVGSVDNDASISKTHSDLNSVALGAGLTADVAGMLDLRVKSTITNPGGDTLERITDLVTISVTAYNVFFPNLYLVGGATAPGWNPGNNNNPLFRDPNTPNGYTYTGYFGADAFKLIEVIGQWQPQWGTNDGSTLAVNLGGGSDPGTFNVAAAGYYTYNFTTVGETGNFTATAYDASAAATYTTIGIIGDATPNGWGSDTDMTQASNDPHIWYINDVTLIGSKFLKFRAENDWPHNWGYDSSNATDEYGIAQYGWSDNIPVATDGTYDIWFNDLTGHYILISK
ncbi:SusE domain-containing protein [Polaribacter sp. Hel1_85]|uniref:SusE domain-containing protein n=1 Tax=Polaribacter sp. Hel1_85 TaxID=1250005 RepID=UPI00052C2027|nr:SusE domain-containing protein [Polaribacter sp. Hel1_85]KGL63872.1 SusE-like outer membrane protein [Polaribacter sp. Hel1_85]